MVDRKSSTSGSGAEITDEAVVLEDAEVMRLLASEDADSLERLADWLKANPRAFAPIVMQASRSDAGLSVQGAAAVLDGLGWRAQADEAAVLEVMETCLGCVSCRLTESLDSAASATISESDDALVSSAVAVLTADRRSRHSEAAIRCMADAGPGGALILARAFDAVRGGLKLYIVRRLDPADVLVLDDNVVASLADSVSRLVDELERPKRDIAARFLAELGPVHAMRDSEIGAGDQLGVGDAVFHARWGAGTVVAANDESATIDFGSAGTRTLLRELTTLRRGVS